MEIFNTREDLFKSFEKNLVIAEIGIFKGEFSKFIFNNLFPKKLILVDIFEGYVSSGDKDGINISGTNMEDEYLRLNDYFKDNENVFLVKERSENFIPTLEDNSLDLIYLDADHEYSSVKNELTLSFPKIKDGGYICGHDYTSPRFEGLVRAVNEFSKEMDLPITHMGMDGCPTFCIAKRKKN